jgi:hypothetical protein
MELRVVSTYQQQAFESLQRMEQPTSTYPGSIRAATPGPARHGGAIDKNIIKQRLVANAQTYWRPVTDDPERELHQHVRVRFKIQVFSGRKWVTQLHIVQVRVSRSASMEGLAAEVRSQMASPFLSAKPFVLARNGQEIPPDRTLADLQLSPTESLDAIDPQGDHLEHLEGHRLKTYDDDIPPSLENTEPYKMNMAIHNTRAPGYAPPPQYHPHFQKFHPAFNRIG